LFGLEGVVKNSYRVAITDNPSKTIGEKKGILQNKKKEIESS